MFKSKNKRISMLFLNLFIILSILSACNNKESNSSDKETESKTSTTPDSSSSTEERTLTDAQGHEVNIPANPKRVLASYLEDNLVALGIKPVAQWSVNNGADTLKYLGEDLKGIPTIPSELPFEVVASYKPDLIIIDSADIAEGGKYDQYAKISPTYVIGTGQNNDWRQELLTIGEVFDKSAEAQKVLDEYEEKAQVAKEKLKESVGSESVAAIWLVSKQFFVVSDTLSSGAVLYQDLELTAPNVVKELAKNSTGNWSPISLEKLAELEADHLFLINSDKGTGVDVFNDPLLQNIPAVKKGHVYEYPADTSWLYTGTIANSQIIDDVLESMDK